MGMNEVEQAMARYEHALNAFNDSVYHSSREIRSRHAEVDTLWQDNMRRDYDARWLPLENKLIEYRDRIGPQYVEVMQERLRVLRRYLYGH